MPPVSHSRFSLIRLKGLQEILKFKPVSSPSLLSASSDGLISVSNPLEQDEDEAVVHVANWGCSVAHAGWFANAHQWHIWSASDMETMKLWSDELDSTQDFGDARELHLSPRWKTDFVIDAQSFGPNAVAPWAGGLAVFVGSNDGGIAVASMDSSAPPYWRLNRVFSGSHSDIVRCVLWDEQAQVMVSGGEDSKINVWNCLGSENSIQASVALSRKREPMSDDDEVNTNNGQCKKRRY